MSESRNARDSDLYRRKVRQMLLAGMSASAIAKATGKSYKHAKQVVDQLIAEGQNHE